MGKIYTIPLLMTIPLYTANSVAAHNPFFGDTKNQLMLNLGQGFNSFALIAVPEMIVPFNMIQLTYSQPSEFFRMPARINISAVKTIGYGKKYQYTDYTHTFTWDWQEYSSEIFVLTQDVALLHTKNWYFGAGIGMGMQGQQNERMGTKMMFAFKIFTGYRIADRINAELFAQHFSNGDAGGEANYSYNFWGLGFGYSF